MTIATPVVYNFFIRPRIASIVFEQIKKVKPKTLYLVSDGPRNNSDRELIYKNREQISAMIDWDCNLFYIYFDDNLGPNEITRITYETVFEREDSLIYLEEDILPSESFFYFSEMMLEKYRFSDSVFMISGMNFLQKYPLGENAPDYFFAHTASTWGFAIWKRTYISLKKDLSFLDNPYYYNLIKRKLLNDNKFYEFKNLLLRFNYPNLLKVDGEFWLMGFNPNVTSNQLAIIPSKNLVKNIGDTFDSENSDEIKLLPKRIQKFSNLKLYELDFPLVDPLFLTVDYNYYDTLGWFKKKNISYWIKKMWDSLERGLRVLIFKGPGVFFFKARKMFMRVWRIERKKWFIK